MKAQEFAYWLQGYFEIAEPATVELSKIEIIKKHLSLVFEFDKVNSHIKNFCYRLSGMLAIQRINGQCLDEDTTALIKSELSSLFAHSIDPTYGNEVVQNKLNQIHGTSTTTKPNKPSHTSNAIARC